MGHSWAVSYGLAESYKSHDTSPETAGDAFTPGHETDAVATACQTGFNRRKSAGAA